MDISKDHLAFALLAGVASVFLYILSASGSFFSILMAYTPLLPLLLVGLAYGPRSAAIAGLFATLIAGGAISLTGLIIYGGIYAIPATLFTQISLTRILGDKEDKWYPVGGALTGLSLYTAVVLSVLIAVIMQDASSMADILPKMEENIPQWVARAQEIIVKAPFLIFGIGAWVQLLMLYAIAVFANFMLAGWQREIRHSLRLRPFMPSMVLLAALLFAGIVSFSDTLSMQVAGKTAFIILLFPYFIMGIARMHARAESWPNRKIIFFIIYLLTVLVFWPVFWFIGAGLFEQAKFLSNRHIGGTDK